MDSFHQRIAPSEIQRIWQSVRESGVVDAAQNSVIVHDLGKMRQRINVLANAFPDGTIHALAIKANPLLEILKVAVQVGAGLEAASLDELELALAAGCPTNRIVFDSPAKTCEEIKHAIDSGVQLNANSFAELLRIDNICTKGGNSLRGIGLRINPEVGAGSISHTSVGSSGSKFGVSISRDHAEIMAAFSRYDWLTGLHVHVGSQGCGLPLLCKAAAKIQRLRQEIEQQSGRKIEAVNIGGGLPATYDGVNNPPTPHAYANELQRAAPELMKSDVQLVTEFGRSVQAGCGFSMSRVEYVRADADRAGDQSMAVIHLGADFLMRPVYRSSEWAHEFVLFDSAGQIKSGPSQSVTIAGPLCFAGDILARDLPMPRPEPGDWIAIRDTGAYTLSMWSRHCSRGMPVVVGYTGPSENRDHENESDVIDEGVTLLRRAESPEDVVRFWSK